MTKRGRSHNSKVSRLLSALAFELKDLPEKKQQRIDRIINDERDGYIFDWSSTVQVLRRFSL